MVPTIPTAEVQITVLSRGRECEAKAVILNASNRIPATKNSGGMHLVFRYVPSSPTKSTHETSPPVEVTFPDEDRAMQAFLPLCGGHDFISNGIRLQSGQWVTIEVKPSIGLQPGESLSLPFDVAIAGAASGSGRPDDPIITIQC